MFLLKSTVSLMHGILKPGSIPGEIVNCFKWSNNTGNFKT